ncbi:hypothetical protein [Sulfolobus acidocaldarius]|uniref:Uncharacterized protein n=2 Tax=Sulfolobus acidocaldarius TaxID=2285 RepID=M1J0H8_9CREN|nr:hypothetical protein [Sulfolobus acidocaldarius]AGE71845.1 hypothetical protein SacN8_09430 [Sulfolobus acidocaldarius N8]AGE74117.1 hypothetical protein SacRon12I_09450 [Sulfolobus acidocaldarius Ron12/I]
MRFRTSYEVRKVNRLELLYLIQIIPILLMYIGKKVSTLWIKSQRLAFYLIV